MHILGASRTLPFHSIGGMQAIAWDLFREFARSGHRVTVLTTAIPGRAEPFDSEGVTVVPVPGSKPESYSQAWWAGSDQAAQALHARTPVDAVLSISVAAAGMKQFKRAAPQVRFVMQAHGTSWGEFQSKWRSGQPLQWAKSVKNLAWLFKDAAIYRWFDHIVLVGDVLAQQFGAWPMPWVVGEVPRTVIRNGVDTERFRPDPIASLEVRKQLGIQPDQPLIVFAARLHPQKGARQLLEAFEFLAAANTTTHLLIVGGGENEAALRALAQASSHSARIHFTGAVDRSRMPSLLAAGQVFAFPSLRQEGLPMNVLEALACGLPVIVSQSMQNVFLPTDDLSFSDPKNPMALADAFAQALRTNPSNSTPRCRLTPDYGLTNCTQAYARLLAQPEP
jgi:glycosyltransferase involved in cell wall biosynthesis